FGAAPALMGAMAMAINATSNTTVVSLVFIRVSLLLYRLTDTPLNASRVPLVATEHHTVA
ncbi:MAG: hypothetical protein M3328_05095, partial [Chloroflexota bacterium]|nr:hypothetical protein [Chloroflexota bacterium]